MAPKRSAGATAKAPAAKKAKQDPKPKAAPKAKAAAEPKSPAKAKPVTPKKGTPVKSPVKKVAKPPAKSPAKKPPAKPAPKKEKAAATPKVAKKAAEKKEKAAPAPKKETTVAGALKVGDLFPDIGELEVDTSTADAKAVVNLKTVAEESPFIVFFYPKANTPGCTKQACGFNDNYGKLEEAGYKIFGMSADKPASQANWKKKYGLKYQLLSDPSRAALKKLGVAKGASSIHRSHIVVAKGGEIRDVRVSISPGDSVTEAVAKASSA